MKKNITEKVALTLAFPVIFLTACSGDTNGFSASDVCPEDGVNAYGMANRGTFTDERDGREYKYTTIGDQVWMAENLDYATEYSVCYDNDTSYCEEWGRYYALLKKEYSFLRTELDYNRVDSVCPLGWHVPTYVEWMQMIETMGKLNDKGTSKKLIGMGSWKDDGGSDDCGFSMLPTGWGNYVWEDSYGDGPSWISGEYDFEKMYNLASAWTGTMQDQWGTYVITFSVEEVAFSQSNGTSLIPIRCIKD